MRSSIILVLLAVVSLLSTMSVAAQEHLALPDVFKIEASDCLSQDANKITVQTGFRIQGDLSIVTALHGVVGCETISAHSPLPNVPAIWDLKIVQVDIDKDVAKLQAVTNSKNDTTNTGLQPFNGTPNDRFTGLYMVGYPYGINAQMTTQQINLRSTSSNRLQDLVPPNVNLQTRGSPAPNIDVISLEAHLVPGHSGAPVLNGKNQVIGIGDGGLGDGFSWIIPWNDIQWQPITAVTQALSNLAKLDPQNLFLSQVYQSNPAEYQMVGRVLVTDTKKFIQDAKVILSLTNEIHTTYTDSDGNFTLDLNALSNDGQLYIEAAGYEILNHNLSDMLNKETLAEFYLTPLPNQPPPTTSFTVLTPASKPTTLPYSLDVNQTYEHPNYVGVMLNLTRIEFREDDTMRWYMLLSNQSTNSYELSLNFQNAYITDEQNNQYKVLNTNIQSDTAISLQPDMTYNYWFDAPLPKDEIGTLSLSLDKYWNSQSQQSNFEIALNAIQIPPIESDHPYNNNMEQSWTINNATGSNATRLHFGRIDIEDGVDRIEIRDQNNLVMQEINTSYSSGLWSEVIPANSVQVVLISDSTDPRWGFMIDQIEPITYTTLGYSPHPSPNNSTDTKYMVNDTPNPDGTQIHFDRIELENEVDYLVIKDTQDVPYQWITGSHPDGFTSKAIPGSAVQVQLVSDGSGKAWGYNIEAVQSNAPTSPDDKPSWDTALAESEHPYDSNIDHRWTVVNPDVNAVSSKVHFSAIKTYQYHKVEILDERDTVIQTLSGEHSDLWSDYVPGRVVKIRLKGDNNNYSGYWGFRVDAIKNSVTNPGLAQSNHPYASDTNQTWTLVNPDVNAVSSKVHFSAIQTYQYHTVEILDEKDTVIQTLSGEYSDLWSDYVPGRVVKIRLKGDNNNYSGYWGFQVDVIKNSVTNPGLAQSDHPYKSNISQTLTVINPDVKAVSSKVHFSAIQTYKYHTVEILDEKDTVIQTLSGEYSDLWSDYVPGRVVKIRLKGDNNNYSGYWGFRVDAIKNSVANPGLAQSNHPYASDTNQTWTLVNPDVNAVSSKVHFSAIQTYRYHTIEILDEKDIIIQTLSGEHNDLWSDYVPGRIVKIRLKGDNNNYSGYWGFRVDAIESK